MNDEYTSLNYEIVTDKIADEITIHPFGDIHWDSETCSRDKFDADLKASLKGKNNYYLFMGDLLDFLATSDLKKVRNAGMHDNSMDKLNVFAMQDLAAFRKKIEPCRGKIIGMLGGNHDWLFDDNLTGSQKLAQYMECAYLGWVTYIILTIRARNHKAVFGYDIVACHGKAGGKLAGTSFNQVEDLQRVFPGANMYLMGHDHNRGVRPTSKLFGEINKHTGVVVVKEREQLLCRTGSYQKAYEPGRGGYITRMLKAPSALGTITIKLQRERIRGSNTPEGVNETWRIRTRVEV
jgi:hypothetical protein